MNKKLTAAIISLILILSITFGMYVSSVDEPGDDTGEIVTGEETGVQSDDPQPVTEEPADTTGEVTGEDTGIDTAEVTGEDTGEDTGEVTGEVTGEDTGEVTGEDTGDDTGEVTGDDTGEDTGEDTEPVTDDTTEEPIKLEGIEFERSAYRLHVGDTVTVVVKAIPEGAELPDIGFIISDDNVAEITNEGVVTAVQNGKTSLRATTRDGRFSCDCSIIVSASDLNMLTIEGTGEKIINGFKLGTTVKEAITDICVAEDLPRNLVKAFNPDHTDAAENASVATGMILSIDSVEYVIIIYGDINGDGIINNSDTQTVADYVTGRITLRRAFMIAADLKGDGMITIENALMIQRHIYGYAPIIQARTN